MVRPFDNFEEESSIGDPAVDSEASYSAEAAPRLSVDPEQLGPRTRVERRGVLALTSCGRERGAPTGVLEV